MLLRVEDLYVEAGGRLIVRGINLEIDRGEIHIIIGPNGAGKSTLLYAISGIPKYRIVRGRILFNNEDITNLTSTERVKIGICLMHQFQPQIKTVKVKDIEEYIVSKFGKNKLAEYAREILEIDKLENRSLFHNMSGGERKRLELYLTLLTNPKLVLLDEPDSGVDVDSLFKIAEVINRIVSEGIACILVTHRGDIVKLLKKVDRVYVMCSGKIVESDGRDVLERVLSTGFAKVCEKLKSGL